MYLFSIGSAFVYIELTSLVIASASVSLYIFTSKDRVVWSDLHTTAAALRIIARMIRSRR